MLNKYGKKMASFINNMQQKISSNIQQNITNLNGNNENIDIDLWTKASIDRNPYSFNKCVNSLPDFIIAKEHPDFAIIYNNSSFENRVNILIFLTKNSMEKGCPELAIDLATAGIDFCQHSYNVYGAGIEEIFIFGVSQFVSYIFKSYESMGYYSKMLSIVENAIKWLLSINAHEKHIVDLRFYRISALIENNRLEEAREKLDFEAHHNNINHISYNTLLRRLNERLKPSTDIKEDKSAVEEVSELQENMEKDIQTFLSQTENSGIKEVIENFELNSQEKIKSNEDAISSLGKMLGQFGSIANLFNKSLGNKVNVTIFFNKVIKILHDPIKGYETDILIEMSNKLESIRRESEDIEIANHTLWLLFLCYKRLKKFDEAFNILQEVRKYINERRKNIKDPLKRAGISDEYPKLYLELASILINRDNAGLLSVIEEAKGRALSDKLAIETGKESIIDNSSLAENWLPDLVKNLNIHYISYLVDIDVIYAICITKQGNLHSKILPIASKLINELRPNIDPSTWGKKIKGFFYEPDDVAQQLSPLVNWLEDLYKNKVLCEHDHICYSPDGLLHLVPLHYVDFLGVPMVKLFSLSRVHSATLLRHFVLKNLSKPEHYISVKVPLADEINDNPQKIIDLSMVSEWLGDNCDLPGKLFENEKADMNNLKLEKFEDALVHFSTHGYFPKKEENKNPFKHSGPVLSKDGHLPKNEKSGDILSPECIIKDKNSFNFKNAHVTLQACVSGLSEEGVAGDALGPEWSLLMAGAGSVLSSHWNIPAKNSADFCITFYTEWLINKRTRAQAWRSAVLSQMDDNNFFNGDNAYLWAAFSLAGDWR